MSSCRLHEGLGSFVFSHGAATMLPSIRVFLFRPKSSVRDARIVIAMHGLDRAAADFRDVLVEQAGRTGQIVLVPEFDAARFPGVYAYNYGNVRRPPPNETIFPRDFWNFSIIDRLFEHVRTAVRADRETFGLFGISVRAQFVLRYLALTEATAVDAAAAAYSEWYGRPGLAVGDQAGGVGLAW